MTPVTRYSGDRKWTEEVAPAKPVAVKPKPAKPTENEERAD